MISRWARFVCIFLVSAAGTFAGPSEALALQDRLIEVFNQNKDAIVRVKAAYRDADDDVSDGKAQITMRVGTGFFFSKKGHVLVSASRAAGANRVWVEFKGKTYATETVGHDRLTNVSILQVLELPDDFSIIQIDSSLAVPSLGAMAIAISCPLDFDPSPAMGMITGKDKKLGSQVFPTEYIRTSIPVDAGQGGCPILDINGRFIGMTVASIPEIGGSYCLPVAALARVRDDLLFSGHMIYGWMGFEVAETLDSDETHSVYLSKVIEGAPAEEAGLLKDDHLVSIGGREILEVADVPGAVFHTRPNQFTSIKIRRDNEILEFSVKTLPRPENDSIIESVELSSVKVDAPASLEAKAVETEPASQ